VPGQEDEKGQSFGDKVDEKVRALETGGVLRAAGSVTTIEFIR
jgi:hypothetical protein